MYHSFFCVADPDIPDFWVFSIRECADLELSISRRDETLLRYLDDITVEIKTTDVWHLLKTIFERLQTVRVFRSV